MTDDGVDGRIGFETDGETLRIRDALEGEEFLLELDREPALEPALGDLFLVPIDHAVSFEVESVAIPSCSDAAVRDADGNLIQWLYESTEFNRGTYFLDLSGVMKVFLRVAHTGFSATGLGDSETISLTFERPTTVTIGARSLHTSPEATITVSEDPAAIAEAVSVLGSSIKEFTPERSWPTLRGHPPRIRIGEELDIPSPLVAPETGVEVVVRPTYADVYRLSTLSFYLGARMVVGDEPAIRFENGFVEPLPTDGVALEERAEELLRTWFFLDTLARTEGYFKSDRYEYEQVGSELPFYPPNLADSSMSERLMEYLEVTPETVAPYTPAWSTEAVVRPVPEAAELLPYFANALAPVRVRGTDDPAVDAPIALATSPWAHWRDDETVSNDVPSPDETPVPAGTAVLTTDVYENQLTRINTARGKLRLVALAASEARATELRQALSEPEVPGGVGSWEVIENPDGDTVARLFADPDVDILYCALPTEGADGVVTATGTVSIDKLDDAPALVFVEGIIDPSVGGSIIEAGGQSAVFTEHALTPESFRSLSGLLAIGLPVGASISLSGVDSATQTRIVGDPGSGITSQTSVGMRVHLVRSESPTTHYVEYTSIPLDSPLVGMEHQSLLDEYQSLTELVGTGATDGPTIETSEIFDILEEGDSIVHFNGRILLPEDVDTEADIERLAEESLAEDDDAQEQRPPRSE
ncbi:hypothetical protein [Halorubrum sp. PV6]|uniref:hypothetical protein n=1 Tax=Halorubrum sp. PV6 TaxID=634157 RepID=UPI000F85212A|nr:hypothetical protein [Halorubrum sp. PV6]AZQ14193.1 hypothetical protein DOS48_04740 [Halorubrum sp. PV6]